MTNTTGRAVRIVDRTSSCGCTHQDLTKTYLQSGESAELTIRMDVSNVTAERVALVTLHTDHPRFPRWVYRLETRVYRPVWFEVPTIDLGEFDEDGPSLLEGSTRLHVCYPGGQPAPPPLQWQCAAGVNAWVDEKTRANERDRYWRIASFQVQVEVDATHQPIQHDQIEGFLKVRASEGEAATLRWVARPIRPFASTPSVAHFGSVRPGEVRTLDLLVRSRDDRPFCVRDVFSDGPHVSAFETTDDPPAASAHDNTTRRIRLELKAPGPGESTGPLRGEVRLALDRDDKPLFSVPWLADLVAPPQGAETDPDH